MEGYKKYGAFTVLFWRTWKKRYEDFIESLKKPPSIIIFGKVKIMNRILRELHLFFNKIWNYVPILPAFISVPLFNSEKWYYFPEDLWFAFEPLLARFLGIKRIKIDCIT